MNEMDLDHVHVRLTRVNHRKMPKSDDLSPSVHLDTIINSRKQEVKEIAEAKRKLNGRRLEDAFRIAVIDPDPYNLSGQDPTSLFPEELWEIILNEIKKPDVENVRNTCTLFQTLMERRRFQKLLFPSVFKIDRFREFLWEDKPDPDQTRLTPGEKDLKLHLKFRLVCKSWRNVVDQHLRSKLEQYEQERGCGITAIPYRDESGLVNYPASMIPTKYGLHLNDFYSNKNYIPMTPRFITKSLEVRMLPNESFEGVPENVGRLLQRMGDKLWLFNAHMKAPAENDLLLLVQFYHCLNKWSVLMENLRWLRITAQEWDGFRGHPMVGAHLQELKVATENSPFPRIPKLRKLSIQFGGLGAAYCQSETCISILTSNPQLREFEMSIDAMRLANFDERLRSAIRALSLESFLFQGGPFSTIADIHTIFNINWKLKKIWLDVLLTNYEISGNLFQILELSNTLQHVTLHINIVQGDPTWSRHLLCLPNVTYFSCKINYKPRDNCRSLTFESLDFLLPMEKLEFLRWYGKGHGFNRKKPKFREVIQFKRGKFDMHRSNIWDIFPALKVAQIRQPGNPWKIYKRNDMKCKVVKLTE